MKEYKEEFEKNTDGEGLIEGRNAVTEALRAGTAIDKLYIARGETDRTLGRIAAEAKKAGIVVVDVDRRKLDAMSATHSHQGVIAVAAAQAYASIEDIFARAEQRGEKPLIVVCDEISDPHNLGAIVRSAECVGAHGVIIPERRSVGLTPAAVKAAAGACEYMNVVRVTNLNRTLEDLKARGLWIVGATMDGEDVSSANLTGPLALVIGAEGEGISQLVEKNCDMKVSLPMRGHIESLNASVAAGVLLYAVLDARRR